MKIYFWICIYSYYKLLTKAPLTPEQTPNADAKPVLTFKTTKL